MYYANGGSVGGFRSVEETFPVILRHGNDGEDYFASGGLAQEARSVRGAGRNGDTELVHVNKAEMAHLREMWGEPTTNPETGLPEFFLGIKFKKILKPIKKIASVALPIAGTVIGGPIGGAIGGALGSAVGGGNLGQILTGGAMGGLGGAIMSPGGLTGAAPVSAAGATGAAGSTGGLSAAAPAVSASPEIAPAGTPGFNAAFADAFRDRMDVSNIPMDRSSVTREEQMRNIALERGIVAGDEQPKQSERLPAGGERPNWFQRESIIKGIPNWLIATGALTLLPQLFKGGGGGYDRDIQKRIGHFQQYGYAEGGYAHGGERDSDTSFAVSGAGDGRSDDIPARLSDGEYVIDAETVALLGNGSTKAGAKRLDEFRVNIRKHKGSNLARGKFSHSAKSPERYMRGGAR